MGGPSRGRARPPVAPGVSVFFVDRMVHLIGEKAMNVLSVRGVAVAATVSLVLAGCGGGGGASAPKPVFAGKVVDGYVSNATVTLDVNDDRVCQATEPRTTTDAEGNYVFAQSLGKHMVCASGGVDIATGQPFVGELLAPPGATQVTPLTSVVMAQINADSPPVAGTPSPVLPATVTAAATEVATNLGLAGTDLLTTDPVAVAATQPALLQVTAAVQVLLVQTASVLQASSGDGTANAASENTRALYATALQSIPAVLQATPVTAPAQVGSIATAVVQQTTTAAQADPAIAAALPALTSLSPASVAAFAGPSLQSITNLVASQPTASMLNPVPDNPVAAAQSTPEIANTTGALAETLLTVTAQGTFNPTELQQIASAALPTSSGGLPVAAPTATIIEAVKTVEPAVEIAVATKIGLDQAKKPNNAVGIGYIEYDTTAGKVLWNSRGASPSDAVVLRGKLTDITVGLLPPRGLAVNNALTYSGVTANAGVPVGAAPGQALSGSAFNTPIRVTLSQSIAQQLSTRAMGLDLNLDRAVLFQTTGTGTPSLVPLMDAPPSYADNDAIANAFAVPLVHPAGKFLYKEINGGIYGYAISSVSGELTALTGTPYTVTGTVARLAMSPNGKFLAAAHRDTNQVSVFAIDALTGALTPVAGSPFTGGYRPEQMTFDGLGRFLYVWDFSAAGVAGEPLLSIYAIDGGSGALTRLSQWPRPYNLGIAPEVIVDSSGTRMYTLERDYDSGVVALWQVNAQNGNLDSPVPDNPGGNVVSVPGGFPLSLAMDPQSRNLYVTVRKVNPGANTSAPGAVQAYTINAASGVLTQGGAVTVGHQPSAIRVAPNGKFAYLVSNGPADHVPGIDIYAINAATGQLTPTVYTVARPAYFAAGAAVPESFAFSASGDFVYVNGRQGVANDEVVAPYAVQVEANAISGSIPDDARLTVTYWEASGSSRSVTISGATLNAASVLRFDYQRSTLHFDIEALLQVISASATPLAPKLALLEGFNGGGTAEEWYSLGMDVPVLSLYGRQTFGRSYSAGMNWQPSAAP